MKYSNDGDVIFVCIVNYLNYFIEYKKNQSLNKCIGYILSSIDSLLFDEWLTELYIGFSSPTTPI